MHSYKVNHRDADFAAYIKELKLACDALGPDDGSTPTPLGLDVIPVIPVDLPVEEFHQLTKDAAGQWVPRLDSKGNMIPFSPKAPAYWQIWVNSDGSEQIRRKSIRWGDDVQPYDPAETWGHICAAGNIGHAIGLALKLSAEFIAIDFDVKPYVLPEEQLSYDAALSEEERIDALAPARARMEAEVEAWRNAHPITRQTRAERTPSGGYHFYFRVADSMQSWSAGLTKDGKQITHVQFALAQDGTHRGEVLCGRICVCAPTQNGRGPYEVLDEAYAYEIAEVPNLEALGIYPVAKQRRERVNKDGTRQTLMREAPAVPNRPQSVEGFDAPVLLSLLGKKAVGVMTGSMPYGPDRSTNLAGFIRELYGWVAFLHDQELPYEVGFNDEDLNAVIYEAAAQLGLDDDARVERIIRSVDLRYSNLSCPPGVALEQYRTQAGGDLPPTFSGLKETDRNPLELCAASLRDVLAETVALNLGKADLSFKLKEIADEFEEPLYQVEKLYKSLADEAQGDNDAAEAIAELVRLRADGQDITGILPVGLTNLLLTIRRTQEYDPALLLITLVSAASGAMPLTSSVRLSPVEDFEQCLNVWLIILMESGELKSPLLRRVVTDPYRRALKDVVGTIRDHIIVALTTLSESGPDISSSELNLDHLPPESQQFIDEHLQQVQEFVAENSKTDENASGPSPKELRAFISQLLGRPPQLLLTSNGTQQGLDANFEACERWAGKGTLLTYDEMKALFLKLAKPSSTEQAFAEWLLSRYDGQGSLEAKADQSRIRNYDTCRLTVIGGIQPDVYRSMLSDGDTSGMTARFNAYEQAQVEQHFPEEFSATELREAVRLKEQLYGLYRAVFLIPHLDLSLSTDAFKRFQAFRRSAFQLKRAEFTDAAKSLANKAHGKVGRLAAVLHVIDHAWEARDSDDAPYIPKVIQLETIERAIKLHELLFKQTLGVRLSSADNSETAQVALKIHRMAKGKPDGLSLGAIRQGFRGQSRPSNADVLAACQQLHAQSLGRLEEFNYRGQAGHRYIHLRDA